MGFFSLETRVGLAVTVMILSGHICMHIKTFAQPWSLAIVFTLYGKAMAGNIYKMSFTDT